MKAQLCPVCNGSGYYSKLPGPESNASCSVGTCHGCAGKGWVSVPECESVVTYRYHPAPYYGGWVDQYGIWHQGY